MIYGNKFLTSNAPSIQDIDLFIESTFKNDQYLFESDKNINDIYYLNEASIGNFFKEIIKAIKEAVLAVREGRKYFCPRFEQMYRHLENVRTSLVKKNLPTPREQEVLQAISEGLSTCEIAVRLCLTENTVESYRKSLMTKLEARNMADLVVKAMQRGFIKPHNDF